MKVYFLWKRTPHGSIRVSCDGFSDFVNYVLSGKSRCRSLSLTEGENSAVTLVLSPKNAPEECCKTEERLASIIAPLGLRVQVIWADRGTPGAELCETLSSAYRSPWAWMLAASLVSLKFMAGWNGLFWTIFWGTAAWFASKFIIFIIMKRKMGFSLPLARR
jgi:hypothetical protein